MLQGEIIAVYIENQIMSARLKSLNVKPGRAYKNKWVLNHLDTCVFVYFVFGPVLSII
jgi:hypothetical protein